MKTTRSPSKHGTGYGTSDFPKAPASLVLRLFAAWLVVVGHCPGIQGRSDQDFLAQWTHGRFSAAPLGITIFFVLSGYLVAGSASRSRDWIDFTWRRVRRIAPGWIACWMLVCLVLGPFATRLDLGAYWGGGELLRTMLGFVGSAHWELPGVFMDHALRSANGSVWTIPYEVALYGILGLVVYGFGRKFTGIRWFVLSAWVILACLLTLPGVLPDSPDTRFLGFRIVFFVQFAAYFVGGWALSHFRLGTNTWRLLVCCAAVVRISSFGHPSFMTLESLSMPVLVVWIASLPVGRLERIWDFSYGYYLWGWPAQQLIRHLYPGLSGSMFLLVSSVSTIGPAVLSWLLVERRFLRRSSRSIS